MWTMGGGSLAAANGELCTKSTVAVGAKVVEMMVVAIVDSCYRREPTEQIIEGYAR